MISKSSASLKFDSPVIKTTATPKPQKTNMRVSMLKPKKSKINIIKKK